MKTNTQLLALIAVISLFISHTTQAQILQTKSEIIEAYGEPFSAGVTKDGENFLYYKIPITTKNSGTYQQCRVMFFKTNSDGSETCYKWKILEPKSEMNYNISSFTNDLVEIGDMKWKDFDRGIFYQIEEKNGACKITAWYDNEASLVRVYKF